jgi:hypothetical protein
LTPIRIFNWNKAPAVSFRCSTKVDILPNVIASSAEKSKALPGDAIVASPMIKSTHAVSINATPDKVWPWIVQLGQGRGGFYSYTLFENLLGCQMKNADRIHPEWQEVAVGDTIPIHPRFPPLIVKGIQAGRHLVLWQQVSFVWSWSFVLEPATGGSRLLVRTRVSKASWAAAVLLWPVMTVGHFLMERKMLLGIKQRCERI